MVSNVDEKSWSQMRCNVDDNAETIILLSSKATYDAKDNVLSKDDRNVFRRSSFRMIQYLSMNDRYINSY